MKNRITVGNKQFAFPKKKSQLSAKTGGWTERQKAALMEARTLYDNFKDTFTATACPEDKIAGRILAFHDQIKAKIKNAKVRRVICDLVRFDYMVALATYGQPRPPSESGG